MKFSEHQLKLWTSMVKLVDAYQEGVITFSYLVPSLEGLLDNSEIKDNDLIRSWYDHWTPLEIIYAERQTDAADKSKEKAVNKMKGYLLKELQLRA